MYLGLPPDHQFHTRHAHSSAGPLFTEDSEALWSTALQSGWTVERVQGWRTPEGLANADLAYYGSLRAEYAALLLDALGHRLVQPTSEWLAQVPARYRKRAVHYTNLGEARKIHAPVFLKPAEHKLFAAQVYSSGHILPHGSELPDDLPVLISEPVTWRVEYRCFVLDRRVEALSPYWRSGRSPQRCGRGPADPDERRAALAFARTMLADPEVLFPPAGVLDVGEIEGGGWAVVEANPAWASGLYDCKPARILHVLRRACIPLAAVSATDDRWILPGPPERS